MTSNRKIVVVGSGAFGTAIAESLVRDQDKNNEIVLFGIDSKEINDINKNHKNSKYFSSDLSEKLFASDNAEETFKDVDIILLVIPSIAIRVSITKTIVPNMTKPAYFVNLAKGFDYLNNDIISNAIKDSVPKELNSGVLKMAGASFASEVIDREPTAFILAADKLSIAEEVYKSLNNNTMKVMPSDSLDAVEWLSIIKNPLALLQGVVDGLGYQINTRALFFNQAAVEMKRLLIFLNLDESLIFSPAGIGDLFLTGSSKKSRNYSTGFEIGKCDKVTEKILSTFSTTEGLRSIEILWNLSEANKLDMKSIELLYNITYKKRTPSEAIKKYLDAF